MAPASAPKIPDHELLRQVGGGNYGTVWLARNILGSYRAVKVVYRDNFLAQRPYDREYAGIMKYEPLSRGHPGLVGVLHVGRNTADRCFYYIMDLADDAAHGRHIVPETYEPRTLRTDLDRHQRLPVQECLRIGLALTSALGHLHRFGVVHRDIKPSNIIFVNNEPRFADIGLVEDIGETRTFVGSEGYTPPEGPGKPTADLYGLGKVLYEISLGMDQLKFPELPPDFDQWPDATGRRQIFELTRKACELTPRRRFQNADEMYRHLQQILQEAPTQRESTTPLIARDRPPLRVVLVGDVQSDPLPRVIELLQPTLSRNHSSLFVDRPGEASIIQAKEIESEIARADAVLAILTPASLATPEMLAYELQLAQTEAEQRGGRPAILPFAIGIPEASDADIETLIHSSQVHRWPRDIEAKECVYEICTRLEALVEHVQTQTPLRLEAVGGAVPLDSPYYLERTADRTVRDAVERTESVVLIKGARQMGKTSLLARALQHAREQGHRVVNTDLQQLNTASFESLENFYFALGNSLADRLDLDVFPEDTWDSRRDPNVNLERYLTREVLAKLTSPLVWGIDELDRLLPCPFGTEVFALIRSWHSSRALDPSGPWWRLTLIMAYATEAHLFITDLNQSPFNIGTRVALEDFSPEQVTDSNRLHGSPLQTPEETTQFFDLLGGQPYLVRRGLHEMVSQSMDFSLFRQEAERDNGMFTDHVRRLVTLLAKDASLVEAVREILKTHSCSSSLAFHRLRAAGVIRGVSPAATQLRCSLYRLHLEKALRTEGATTPAAS
jgi:serine/threonine protein kinase